MQVYIDGAGPTQCIAAPSTEQSKRIAPFGQAIPENLFRNLRDSQCETHLSQLVQPNVSRG